MRTTLDLPDDILRRAKIAAVERGTSLRQIVINALRREIEEPSQGGALPECSQIAVGMTSASDVAL